MKPKKRDSLLPDPIIHQTHESATPKARFANTATIALTVACSVTLAPFALGQSSDGDSEEIYELSPFVVDASKDVGFVASQSLAGGRLAGDLKETPAAYSVLTSEFIEAVGITSLEEANQWVVGGDDMYRDDGATETSVLTSAVPTQVLIRGSNGAIPQKNFFPFGTVYDSYNTERYDFGRGPNSILFGNGGISGSANIVSKRAKYFKDSTKISTRFGSWNDKRFTLDHNQAFSEKFALRVNAVFQDSDTWRDNEYKKVEGIALASSLKLSENTEFRLEGEVTETEILKGQAYFRDKYSAWNGTQTQSGPWTGPANPRALRPTGIRRRTTGAGKTGSNYYVYAPESGILDLVDHQRTAQTTASGEPNPGLVGGAVVPGNRFRLNLNGNRPIKPSPSRPSYIDDVAIANSEFFLPGDDYTIVPTAPTRDTRGRDISAYLTHNFGENIFFEAAINHSEYDAVSDLSSIRGGNEIYIDINEQLTDGSPNPNFLKPYVDMISERNIRNDTVDNVRASIAFTKDLEWVDFATNLILSSTELERDSRYDTLSAAIHPDSRRWGDDSIIRFRTYLTPENDSYRVNHDDVMGSINTIQPHTGNTATASPKRVPFRTGDRPQGNGLSETTYNNAVLAFNAKFFERRLIVLGALRRDEYDFSVRLPIKPGDNPADWDGVTVERLPIHPDADVYYNLTYIPKDADGNPTAVEPRRATTRPRSGNPAVGQPQYANDVFQDDFAAPVNSQTVDTYSLGSLFYFDRERRYSLFANYAETFQPPPTNPTLFWEPLPTESSTGVDVGFRADIFEGNLNLSFSYFESEQIGAASRGSTLTSPINQLYLANVMGDPDPSGINQQELSPVPPQNVDTADRFVDGIEFEATANFTDSWRLMANYSTYVIETSSPFPISTQFYAENESRLRATVLATGGVEIGSDGFASVILGSDGEPVVPTFDDTSPETIANTASPDRDSAVNSWNNIQTRRALFTAARVPLRRSERFNLFTDYALREGKFKGLRFGAGINYQFGRVIGNRGGDLLDASTRADDPTVDSTDTVFSDDYYTVLANASYSWKLQNGTKVKMQLRINNLLNNRDPSFRNGAIRAPDGDVTRLERVFVPVGFDLREPRKVTFTTSLEF